MIVQINGQEIETQTVRFVVDTGPINAAMPGPFFEVAVVENRLQKRLEVNAAVDSEIIRAKIGTLFDRVEIGIVREGD